MILILQHLFDVECEEAVPEVVLVRGQLVAEEHLSGLELFSAVFAFDLGTILARDLAGFLCFGIGRRFGLGPERIKVMFEILRISPCDTDTYMSDTVTIFFQVPT